jgi:protein SCO1
MLVFIQKIFLLALLLISNCIADVGIVENLGNTVDLSAQFSDENGELFELSHYIDRPTIIVPVYYRCANVCGVIQSALVSVFPQIGLTVGQDFNVLSISFDSSDTFLDARKKKNTYYNSLSSSLSKNAWRFLTGNQGEINKFLGSLGYDISPKEKDYLHPVASIVIDRDGTIIRYLYGQSFLGKEVKLALYQAKEGRVSSSIKRLVKFCFSYDPKGNSRVVNVKLVFATLFLLSLVGYVCYLIVKKP